MKLTNLSTNASGLALLLTSLALLVFAFFAFMGTEYLLEGDHRMVALCCLPSAIILLVFIVIARNIKRGRKKNTALETTLLAGAICIVLVGMVPFSQFVYTIEHEQEINQLVGDARMAARDVDSLYHDYAEQRVTAYKKYLRSDRYRTLKVESLRRRLLATVSDTVETQRDAWLDSLHTINLWNPATARNLYHIITASEEWTRQYAEVSAVIYRGEPDVNDEPCAPFAIDNSDIRQRYGRFTTFHWPLTTWSVVAGLVCCVLMSLYYVACTRSRNKYQNRV